MDKVKLFEELMRDEGIGLKMYTDSEGVPTIGIGHNLRDKPISKEAALFIAGDDVYEVEVGLNTHLPWWTKLDEVRQRVLVNMAFNLGVGPTPENPTGKLLTFPHTLALIEVGDYATAADMLLHSLWYKQVGKRAERLIQAMRSGVMP
jgi:lysozyme